MPQPLKYPWPAALWDECRIVAPEKCRRDNLRRTAYKFAKRHGFLFRTRRDGAVLRVRRVA